jgi:hypothetical protein
MHFFVSTNLWVERRPFLAPWAIIFGVNLTDPYFGYVIFNFAYIT